MKSGNGNKRWRLTGILIGHLMYVYINCNTVIIGDEPPCDGIVCRQNGNDCSSIPTNVFYLVKKPDYIFYNRALDTITMFGLFMCNNIYFSKK